MEKRQPDCLLRMEHITKSFDGIKALDDISLSVGYGEVHALMGENGAGKSTLMKILAGVLQKDKGSIYLRGSLLPAITPKRALTLGIAMIHQELNPVLHMTVAENLFLGREPVYRHSGLINKGRELESARLFLQEMDMDIHPGARMADLSIAEVQIVEIVKAISYNAGLLIMDEPTSALSDHEVAKLFSIIRKIKSKGVSVIYISHKMDEIFSISDTITVFRDGKYIDSKPAAAFSGGLLIRMMVGREVSQIFPARQGPVGAPSLELQSFSLKGKFDNISFTAHAGEIIGFAGLMGAGRTEIMESVFGIHRHDSGKLLLREEEVLIKSPADAVKRGIALISEDRKAKGLNMKGSVKNNISLASLRNYCSLGQIIRRDKERRDVAKEIKTLGIKVSRTSQPVRGLSGGNQQKLVLAKWFLTNPQILILDEPTRGIDVGAKAEIYQLIGRLATAGKTILLISSEMSELLGLCDRIIVVHQGRVAGEFARSVFNPERIMEAAMGNPAGLPAKE